MIIIIMIMIMIMIIIIIMLSLLSLFVIICFLLVFVVARRLHGAFGGLAEEEGRGRRGHAAEELLQYNNTM